MAGSLFDEKALPVHGVGEVVVMDPDIFRDIAAAPDTAVLLLTDGEHVDEALPEAVAEQHQTGRIIRVQLLWQTDLEITDLAHFDGAKGRFIACIPAIVQMTHDRIHLYHNPRKSVLGLAPERPF